MLKRCMYLVVSVLLTLCILSNGFTMALRPPDPESDPIFSNSPAAQITEERLSETEALMNEVQAFLADPGSAMLTESDPVFDKSPSKQITNEDVSNVKNMKTIISDTVRAETAAIDPTGGVPILSTPPETAAPGDRYVNSDSGVTCYYCCEKALGEFACEWFAAPTYTVLGMIRDYNSSINAGHPVNDPRVPCMAKAGISPVIDFHGLPTVIANYEDFGWVYSQYGEDTRQALFDIEIRDADQEEGGNLPQMKGGLVKLSDDPYADESNWNLNTVAAYSTIPFTKGFNTVCVVKVFYYITENNPDGKYTLYVTLDFEGVDVCFGYFDMKGLENGVYGFVFNIFDSNGNSYTSELAPLKFRYIKENI